MTVPDTIPAATRNTVPNTVPNTISHDCNRVNKVLFREYGREMLSFLKTGGGVGDVRKYIASFEGEYAKYAGTKHAFATDSGTSALHMSLLALGIGKGDEVIIPDLTFRATALAVLAAGARPVLADVRKHDLTMDADSVEKAITERTKAIMPVHLFCHPCDMAALCGVAEKHGLHVIEDACQGQGGSYRGRPLGSFGELNATSFNYYKPISTFGGGGGMITFGNGAHMEKLKSLSAGGGIGPEGLSSAGFRSFRDISFLDAATARVKLRHAGRIGRSMESVKKVYESELGNVGQVSVFRDMPHTSGIRTSYAIMAPKRELLMEFLSRNSVLTETLYPLISAAPMFSGHVSALPAPVSAEAYRFGVQLPLFPFMSEDEARRVTGLINKFYSVPRLKSLRNPWQVSSPAPARC